MIAVVSMKHSGSRFTSRLIGAPILHVTDTWDDAEKATVRVSPLRSPEAMWQSYAARGLKLFHLVHAWRQMEMFSQQHKVHWLPLDHPGRANALDRLSKVLGKPLFTLWEKTDSSGKPEVPTPDLSAVYAIGLAKEFYAWHTH